MQGLSDVFEHIAQPKAYCISGFFAAVEKTAGLMVMSRFSAAGPDCSRGFGSRSSSHTLARRLCKSVRAMASVLLLSMLDCTSFDRVVQVSRNSFVLRRVRSDSI